MTEKELGDVYTACCCMEKPAGVGFRPPSKWWRAMIVLAYNTGLRRGALLSLRMTDVDWQRHRLLIPRERMKGRRPHVAHLNATAMQHLLKIRTDRELVFPWPHCLSHFYTCWHRLLTEAGIPKEKHFGLHDLRKTLGTILAQGSLDNARAVLGHAGDLVTWNHYVDHNVLAAAALDRVPQPPAFTAEIGRQAG